LLLSVKEDLEGKNENFHFKVFSVPKIEVCTSTIFSLTSIGKTFLGGLADFTNKQLTPTMILNLIPTKEDSKFSIGFHKLSREHFGNKLENYQNFSDEEFLKEISDLLIRNFETWACSEFFIKNIYRKKRRLFWI